ncbi:hypothetical protein D3C72_2351770 [compost metagenome]
MMTSTLSVPMNLRVLSMAPRVEVWLSSTRYSISRPPAPPAALISSTASLKQFNCASPRSVSRPVSAVWNPIFTLFLA